MVIVIRVHWMIYTFLIGINRFKFAIFSHVCEISREITPRWSGSGEFPYIFFLIRMRNFEYIFLAPQNFSQRFPIQIFEIITRFDKMLPLMLHQYKFISLVHFSLITFYAMDSQYLNLKKLQQ